MPRPSIIDRKLSVKDLYQQLKENHKPTDANPSTSQPESHISLSRSQIFRIKSEETMQIISEKAVGPIDYTIYNHEGYSAITGDMATTTIKV